MTAREMQIEFERRVREIDSALATTEKLDSDTIFAFLNAYTERFVLLNYLQKDQIQSDTRAQKKNQDAIKGLITSKRIAANQVMWDGVSPVQSAELNEYYIALPDDYFLYLRSDSEVSEHYQTFRQNISVSDLVNTPNITVNEEDVLKIRNSYYNNTLILPNPCVVLSSNKSDQILRIVVDNFTKIKYVDLYYYRKPKKFALVDKSGIHVTEEWDLPANVHMEIVEGAVEMYITEARYRLSRKNNSQNQQQ